MKFGVESYDEGAGLVLRATPGEYDAIPLIHEVTVDAVPWTRHPDRVAAACCLVFGSSCAGAFEIPAPGCSPHVASAIENFLLPTGCRVFPPNLVPSRIIGGDVQLNLLGGFHGLAHARPHSGGAEVVQMRLVSEGVGTFASGSELIIATNALLMSSTEERALQKLLPALGVAVLFCEDLFVGQINIATPDADNPSDCETLTKVERLLDSVGLRARWV